jgi:betaine-aldehyde dehydrogenase
VAGLRQDDELVQSEIFGPVITVQSYRDDDEAIAMANGVEQGLTASVWTDSHSAQCDSCATSISVRY